MKHFFPGKVMCAREIYLTTQNFYNVELEKCDAKLKM